MGSTTSVYTDQRLIRISPDNDPSETIFPGNQIVSKKYTIWNFLPKNLFEQFRRIANFYFLLTALISMLITSPISPLTSILPLSFVILMTACKQGYEDYLRHKLDQKINRRFVSVIRNKCTQSIQCEQIVVGDLVKVCRDEDVPCDLLLLFSTEDSGRCYVTTSNLDGETNLKTLHVPKVLSKMKTAEIASMEATVTCQHASSDLYRFHGKLEVYRNDELHSGHLTIENLLLRGSSLKDTDHVIGCAVYTGLDTKLSLNSKIRSNKFSTAEKSINKYIIVFMVLLLVEIILSCMMKFEQERTIHWQSYLGNDNRVSIQTLLNDFLSFAVLYNYIVPISLYVTIELQKFLSSLFFSWDMDMYDHNTEQPALTNSSDLNEELGQIEYLFADKTGTLTENQMVFKRCSVNGKVYMEKNCDGYLYLLPADGNEKKAEKLTTWEQELWHFMISIALCHSVQISPSSQRINIIAKRRLYRESFRKKRVLQLNSSLLMHPDLPEYQAASADEKALVEASARCGVIFHKSNCDKVELKINNGNTLTFEKLEVLEFTSERKRMSVIVKDEADDYWLYCKGADSAILPLIVSGDVNQTIAHVADFSRRGLRTLVIGYKKMNEMEYNELVSNVEEARQVIGIEQATHMEKAYNSMEGGLTLLGVTAVEDRLQEGVQETLESLQVAGIKIWVLTGDKAETAENIAFLCGQFKDGTEILRMLEITENRVCFRRLTDFERRMKLEPYKQYGMIVDGCSISIALEKYPEQFRIVGMACDAVVCCRLTPLQKSEIINVIKKARSQPHTAAIGDGGNDVAMIQEAHVGIGIMGKEGRQATMCSDFAIAKFKFVKKVLLVHGHWYYLRISTLTQYFFYKNFMFITPQLFFGFHSGFSGQAIYDGIFLMLFNVLFTSLPILAYGLLEQDYTADKLLRYPYLYKLYRHNYLLSWNQFLIWTILGCWHTSVIYFMMYFYVYINPVILYNNTPVDQWSFSACLFHLVTLIANLVVLLRSSYWTLPFVAVVVLSQLSFFGVAICYSFITIRYDGDMLRVFQILVSSLTFWILTVIVVIVCLIPDYLILVYNSYRPTFIPRRNEEQRHTPDLIDNNSDDASLRTRYQSLSYIVPWRNNFEPRKYD